MVDTAREDDMKEWLMSAFLYLWRAKFIRFAAVGVFCAIVHYGLFVLLYTELAVHYQVANGAGFIVSLGFNFFLNRHFTFGLGGFPSLRESVRFAGKKGSFYLLGAASLHVLVEYAGLEPWIAQALLIPVLGVLGFLFLRRFVFIA
ncbi:MAG: GtrA family protein [Minisyncoccota bacterium]